MADSDMAPLSASAVDSEDDLPRRQENEEHRFRELDDSREHTLHLETPIDESTPSDSQQSKVTIPVQKRRRVTRACDECRRKKIKCDGKQPCTHCTVYSYECTYDQPSNRRRNPAPQYIEALESRLHKFEGILRAILPGVDLDDPRFDTLEVEELLSGLKKDVGNQNREPSPEEKTRCDRSEPCGESLLESMVENTGSLDLDDQGHWDYRGHSSGLIFMRRLRKQFGGNMGPEPRPSSKFQHINQILEGPKSASESPVESYITLAHELPPKNVARALCTNALEDACFIMRFVHKPTFYAMFDRIYDTPADQYSNEENSFLPLLYLALAAGCLFGRAGDSSLDRSGYEIATDQGFQYFKAGRQLLEITECRDLTSLQAICFVVLFLQSSSNLSTCYSYIGIALRAALRLGLHRSVSANFNPVELELRKRLFWMIQKMDVHVSVILGLPSMLSEDEVDQEYPLPVDDEYITVDGILPMPPNHTSLMAGVNAHIRLGSILTKVTKYIYPVKTVNPGSNHNYMVSHTKIREIEQDLQKWMEALPTEFRPGGEAPIEVERMRQLLRIGYAHVQMIMYRPFLHYVTGPQGRGIDKRSYACAAACVSVARNVVHITTLMKKKQLLNGAYWFTMYTTYIAILSLVFFILENPEAASAKDGILKDALEGKNALGELAKRSMAADRCAQSLNTVFKYLPEKLRNWHSSNIAPGNRKRAQHSSTLTDPVKSQTASDLKNPSEGFLPDIPRRAKTFPAHQQSGGGRHIKRDSGQLFQASIDDSHAATHLKLSLANTNSSPLVSQPISRIPSMSDGNHVHASSTSSPLSGAQHQGQEQPVPPNYSFSFSPSFENGGQLPDLMPMMFPSDDPFAYPNQPMSTLENDHFKHEPSGTAAQFSLPIMPGPSGAGSSATSGTVSSTMASFDDLNITSVYTSQGPSNSASVSIKQESPFPGTSHEHISRPSSHGPPPLPNVMTQNPDLVAIPDQSFLWESLGAAQPASFSHIRNGQQRPDSGHAFPMPPDFVMGADVGIGRFGGLGMGTEMGVGAINLNELFGNSGDGMDEWSQWMNAGGT